MLWNVIMLRWFRGSSVIDGGGCPGETPDGTDDIVTTPRGRSMVRPPVALRGQSSRGAVQDVPGLT